MSANMLFYRYECDPFHPEKIMNHHCLTGLLPEEIAALLPPGKEQYRGMQIFRWIHERGVRTFDEMTNLPKTFRNEMTGRFTIGSISPAGVLSSSDGSTDKFLWKLADGAHIESVIIRNEGRTTACISSQVGCKRGCGFCRTASMGFVRNLLAGEIDDQLIRMRFILRENGEDISNIVFMGMGEPLDNFDELARAITVINLETGLCIGLRKITVSTSGHAPGIRLLSDRFSKVGLAISLNAPNDDLRSRLMPINRRWPLDTLIESARYYHNATKRRVTFEYILIDGVNDSPRHAKQLLDICRRVPSKVNLIAFNEFEGCSYRQPGEGLIEEFQRILFAGNVTAMIRKSKGSDILAACGQLAVPINRNGAV